MTYSGQRDVAWNLVCASLFPRHELSDDALAAGLSSSATPWAHVVRLAGQRLVTPGMASALRQRHMSELLPLEARRYLGAVHEMNARRNHRIGAQLEEVVRLFDDENIDVLLLKGAAHLAVGLYTDPAARILGDLDLLVRRDQIPRAQHLLEELGYRPLSAGRSNFTRHHHVAPLGRPGDHAVIELHRSPVHREYNELLPTDDAWRRSACVTTDTKRYRVLSPADAIVLAIVHVEINDRNCKRHVIDLRVLQDLTAMYEHFARSLDWESVFAHFHAHGWGQTFLNLSFKALRTTGIEFVRDLEFGRLERMHYALCEMSVRRPIVEKTFEWLDEVSPSRISSRLRRLAL